MELKLPTYEQFKEAYIEAIKSEGINDSEEKLINEIFNPESKLYKIERTETIWYDEEITTTESIFTGFPNDILDKINNDLFHTHSLWTELDCYHIITCLIEQLNQETLVEDYDIMEKEFETVQSLSEEFTTRFENETSFEELKNIILSIKRGER